jgi:hypothetical protein
MDYLIVIVTGLLVFISGIQIGRSMERNRQADIRSQSIRLRRFSPPNVSKN